MDPAVDPIYSVVFSSLFFIFAQDSSFFFVVPCFPLIHFPKELRDPAVGGGGQILVRLFLF
jgi:hypothetical protein